MVSLSAFSMLKPFRNAHFPFLVKVSFYTTRIPNADLNLVFSLNPAFGCNVLPSRDTYLTASKALKLLSPGMVCNVSITA